ncbi:MAG TPA: hypothetical protein P5230_03320 [Candidatus Magasanikbacteria bacterium]|nr:hypothetical protein [Candidatus Magasanikbacteria bacterium]
MTKFIKIFLLIYNIIFILFFVSNIFDFDFGWHLRFGKEWLENGFFPYTDGYTYPHLGQIWVNHEWGGDLLYWIIYKNIGYYPLVLVIPLLVLAAFWIAQKTYGKYGLEATLVTTFLVWADYHIFAPRLAMFSLIFFAIFLYTLQNIEKTKLYRFWPLLFWLWSFLHGSFTLGFIVIGIYFTGNLLNCFFQKYYPRLVLGQSWKKETFYKVSLWGLISLVAIFINPYGWLLPKETVSYFFYDFYKTHVTEWLASNTFPIFWKTGLFIAPALVAVFWQVKKKVFSWAELLLFLGLLYISFKYKRQVIYLALFCQPLFSSFLAQIKESFLAIPKWKLFLENKNTKITAFVIGIFLILYSCQLYFPYIKIYKDVWPHIKEIGQYMPVDAVEFLNREINSEYKVKIFNEFGWGAYMNWTLPQGLVFLDGRGTATWKIPGSDITTLETYYNWRYYQNNGLKEIEKQNIQYVILENMNSFTPRVNRVNKWLFTSAALKHATTLADDKLEKDLKISEDWKLIYTDDRANIWKYQPIQPETK